VRLPAHPSCEKAEADMAEQTSAADRAAASGGQRECRVSERHSCGLETSCQPPTVWGDKDLKWSARIEDISQSGLSLVLRRRFEPGSGLAIELPATATSPASTVLVRVVRVQQHAGSWLLGCAFVSRLSEEELKTLLPASDPLKAPPSAEPAEEPAVPAVQPSARLPEAETERLLVNEVYLQGTLPDGRVIKRLIKRLYLSKSWPLAAGDVLALHLSRAPAGAAGLQLRVESCKQRGERWILTCTFLHADADAIWAAFAKGRK
jgi:hypothetical protein